MLQVPRFSRGIRLVWIRRWSINLAVASCGFFGLVFVMQLCYFKLVCEVTTSVKVYRVESVSHGDSYCPQRIFATQPENFPNSYKIVRKWPKFPDLSGKIEINWEVMTFFLFNIF